MNQLKKYPLTTSIIIIIIAIAITFLPLSPIFEGILEEQSAGYLAGFLEQIGVGLVLIYMLKKLGWLKQAGFTGRIKSWWVIWPGILFTLLNASEFLCGDIKVDGSEPLRVLLYILLYLSTGFFEEILMRGVVFSLLLNKWKDCKNGLLSAVLVSSLLFGMVHFVHFIQGDSSFIATMAQLLYSTVIGVFFCACKIRNQNIYLVMLLHGLFDIAGDIKEIAIGYGIHRGYRTMTLGGAAECVIITLPLLLYGLFILRKKKISEVTTDETEVVNC